MTAAYLRVVTDPSSHMTHKVPSNTPTPLPTFHNIRHRSKCTGLCSPATPLCWRAQPTPRETLTILKKRKEKHLLTLAGLFYAALGRIVLYETVDDNDHNDHHPTPVPPSREHDG